MKYDQVEDTLWVSPTLGYFPAIRLSPSGSGNPYKGKGAPRGYLIVEIDENGKQKIDQDNIFLSLDEMAPIIAAKLFAEQEGEKQEEEDKIKNLPYKNILDLQPLVYKEIERASKLFGFKSTDDLTVEVTLEENMELVVRIGPA